METPKEYYYTYYSYEEWGRGYFGSRQCYCLPQDDVKYLGSSKDKTFRPTQKIILKDDYATREEAYADEITLQEYYKVVENPHFANKSYQTSTKFYYKMPHERAIVNGKKSYELGVGIHALTYEERSKMGKITGKITGKVNGKALFNAKKGIFGMTEEEKKEVRSRGGITSSNKHKELGVGFYALTPEQRTENGNKGGKKAKELGVGVHALTYEERKRIGKKGGNKTKELGLGVHALTPEQRSEIGRKTCSQRWMCLETRYISNSGGLTHYQRARGIDTSKRKRVS